MPKYNNLKDVVESKVVKVAKKYFGFDFSLVFYDLTTLYFESFETDEIRKIGFSKDNKSSNPQIMIGLLVDNQGFPISYQIFPGNKFEGHTLMPSINQIRKKHKIKQMTIVADAAMLSQDNINFLKKENLQYIVGARMANLPLEIINEISKDLKQQNEVVIRINTIICFMALSIAKYIEIKTEKSIKSVIKELKRITDAKIYDQINKREVVMRSKIKNEAKEILEKLECHTK